MDKLSGVSGILACALSLAASPDPHLQFAAAKIACESCHPCGAAAVHTAAWMDTASGGFHALSANAGLAQCQSCHGAGLDGVGAASAVSCAACHGDAWKANCTQCHGGGDNLTGAPPRATWGNGGDAVRIGAHTSHLAATLAQPVACGACHLTPADALSPEHMDGPVATVRFAGLAAPAGGAPQWDRATATCSGTYCHGATLTGGAQTAPVWTLADGTQRTCASCHGAPPPPPHPLNPACGSCHAGYGAGVVNAATHVDGKIDVSALTCSSCHGSASNPAPPMGVAGDTATTARGVGAHQAHLAGGVVSRPVACGECHVVPASMLHANGAVELAWGALAAANGAAPAWDGTSCSSVYCHGGTLAAGGTLTAPVWTRVDGAQAACGTCHGTPPPPPHMQKTDCGTCHPGYTAGSVELSTHIDGVVQAFLTCTSCHGDPARAPSALNPKLAAAPPVGTLGETATTARAVGAHLRHLQGGPLSGGFACTECHAVPPDGAPDHPDGVVALSWGPLATARGSAPAWSRSANACSASWCHGARLTGGRDTTPIWTTVDGTQGACGTCHGTPPTSGEHGRSEHRVSCGYCHGGTYTASVADRSRHVNGVFEVNGPRIRSWDPVTRACQSTCHGTEIWDNGGSH